MSTRYRYKKWDGSKLNHENGEQDYFAEFSNYLMDGWSPDEAYEWILKQGMEVSDVKTLGIDDLRAELSKFKKSLFGKYNLDKSLQEPQEKLDNLKARELELLQKTYASNSPEYREKNSVLGNITGKLSSALAALANYDFQSGASRREYDNLMRELVEIKEVEKFRSRFGHKFKGQRSLGFDDVLDLIERMEYLESVEKNLMSSDFDSINTSDLEEILSENGINSIHVLRDFKSMLEHSGYISLAGERTELTPKGVRKIGESAVSDLFSTLKRQKLADHDTDNKGAGVMRFENSREYEFGDPFNIDIVNTIKNSLTREPAGDSININPEDFEIYESEFPTHASTVLLLDLSWSMSFRGRFRAAKRVAIALDHLIRTRFPRDNFHIIGFSTGARPLSTMELAVSSWDSTEPFTNIQDALYTASKTISKYKNSNKQIILITDGQPTAYHKDKYLQVELPMFFGGLSPRATFETLKEVKRVTAMGIRVNTFMLDDSPSLRRFVDEMTRINKGRAFFTTPDELGTYLLVDYLERKKKVI